MGKRGRGKRGRSCIKEATDEAAGDNITAPATQTQLQKVIAPRLLVSFYQVGHIRECTVSYIIPASQ